MVLPEAYSAGVCHTPRFFYGTTLPLHVVPSSYTTTPLGLGMQRKLWLSNVLYVIYLTDGTIWNRTDPDRFELNMVHADTC